MPSLGRLVRGLSALFWSLPAALFVGVQSTHTDWLRPFGVAPALLTAGWLYYGLWQVGAFRRQERIWRRSVAQVHGLALFLVGLSPFLFWWQRLPELSYFRWMASALGLGGLLFLMGLNHLLQRLVAMLPDQTLRQDTRFFTAINLGMLSALLVILLVAYLPPAWSGPSLVWVRVQSLVRQESAWLVVAPLLLPVATTMAMLWKIKETILASVFSGERPLEGH